MRRTHSRTSIFLMEIILNLLLFSILLIVGLQFFIRTHTLTEETSRLHQAVAGCKSVASAFENGSGSRNDFLELYHYSVNLDNKTLLFLDSGFQECQKQDASYFITITINDTKTDGLKKAHITCSSADHRVIYSLTACHYNKRRVSETHSVKEVAS